MSTIKGIYFMSDRESKAAARGSGKDTVLSKTGRKKKCRRPVITKTHECSDNVFINSEGAVRLGDKVAPHKKGGCGPDESALTTGSSSVFINGKKAGRIGDRYTEDNTIISGSDNVFIG
jgi:uncharacterized Zn-binding protein involved in type VI secretion